MKHTISDLYQMQAMPLNIKIRMTQNRIKAWVDTYGEDGVYISFSGGKDSTVLLDIARKMYPDLLAVFVDTGLEYPEIREFVKTFDNVKWLKPKKNFKKVITEHGCPFISKEVSRKVHGARRYVESLRERERPVYANYMADMLGIDRRGNPNNPAYQKLKTGSIPELRGKVCWEIVKGTYGDGKSRYNIPKYAFFLDAPFEISSYCCDVMKKAPAHNFCKQTGRHPMTAQMASESMLRTQQWLANGCNGFDLKSPISNPMSFWTELDVLHYIHDYQLPVCSVYGDLVEVAEGDNKKSKRKQQEQATLELFETDHTVYKFTGCQRTGCMFCGYGCHLEKTGERRFLKMKETHPAQYDYIMRPLEQGGLNYKEVIDWINEHGGFHIEY